MKVVLLSERAWELLRRYVPRGANRGNLYQLDATKREEMLKKALNDAAATIAALERKTSALQNELFDMEFYGNVAQERILHLAKTNSDLTQPNPGIPEDALTLTNRHNAVEDHEVETMVQQLYFVMRHTSFDRIPKATTTLKKILKTPRRSMTDFVNRIESLNPFTTKADLFNSTRDAFNNAFGY